MGHVVISRFKTTGDAELGVFLLDTYCMGVKNAFFSKMTADEYEENMKKMFPSGKIELTPAAGRKLVEDAVAYAAALGIGPHPDYKKACRVLGGINAADCDTKFEFGFNGKPFLISGPSDSMARIEQIAKKLNDRGHGPPRGGLAAEK